MNARGQMEILGLTVVVLLIIIGVLFAVSVMQKPSANIEQEFKEKSLAVNYLNTMLGTTSACFKATFRELIQDCAEGGQIRCPGFRNSCQYTRDIFEDLFDKTLREQKKQFHLRVSGPGDVDAISIEQSCPGELESGIQFVPSRSGTVELVLQICG